MKRHLMNPELVQRAACGRPWRKDAAGARHPLSEPNPCAGDLDDVTCEVCLATDEFRRHAFRAAAANRRSLDLLARKDVELRALRDQVAALRDAGVGLAKRLHRYEPPLAPDARRAG